MCGIVALFHPTKRIETRDVVLQYLAQQSRGREGFGFSYLTETGKIVTKRFMHEASTFHELAKVKSRLILLHHRRPTSTANTAFQNQPIVRVTEKGWYALAHNGIISNDKELRNGEYKDIPFFTEEKRAEDDKSTLPKKFNDSEVLLHALIDSIENGKPLAARGSIAFILLVGDTEGHIKSLRYGRNCNPLFHVKRDDGVEVISSEYEGIKESDKISMDKMFTVDFTSPELTLTQSDLEMHYTVATPVRSTYQNPNKGSFKGYGKGYEDDLDYWERYGDSGAWLKKQDGKSGAYTPPKERDPKIVDRIEAQRDYVECMKMADELIAHLQRLEVTGLITVGDKQVELNEIDQVVRDINEFSTAAYNRVTDRAERAIKELNVQRLRFLPKSSELVKEALSPQSTIGKAISSIWPGRKQGPLELPYGEPLPIITVATDAEREQIERDNKTLGALEKEIERQETLMRDDD